MKEHIKWGRCRDIIAEEIKRELLLLNFSILKITGFRILHTYKEKKRERRRKVEKGKISINNDFLEETATICISVPQKSKVLDSKTK